MSNAKTRKERDINEFCELANDQDRWEWILDKTAQNLDGHVKNNFKLILDNDDTQIVFLLNDDDDERVTFKFYGYIGQGPGIVSMLDAMGVYSEYA